MLIIFLFNFTDGVKLIKSVVRYLIDVYHLPKLLPKVQQKTAHMLALTITATASKKVKITSNAAQNSENEESQSTLAQ